MKYIGRRTIMITINQEKCIGCGACVRDCLALNLQIKGGKAEVLDECLLCGHCYAVCPETAVEMPKEYLAADTELCEGRLSSLDPAALLHSIKSRRSIRDYKKCPVEQEKLEQLLQAGRYTATAKNNQDCYFIFVQEKRDVLKQMIWDFVEKKTAEYGDAIPEDFRPYVSFLQRQKADAADDYLFRNAPVIVYLASDWPLDAGLAAQNMELMAAAQGLGCLYNGFLARITEANPQAKEWLGIPEIPIKACLLLGYPSVKYKRTAPRKAPNAIWR